MIKLKDFTEAVDIYKKNFVLRKKRYASEQRSATEKRRKERESRIEPNKFLNNAGKNVGEGVKKVTSGGGNFLNSVYKFLGFTLLGLIVKNIDKILAVVKTVVDKLKEAFTKIKEFYIETLEPALTSIFEGVGNIMETFEDVFNFVIDVNPLKDFGGLLNTVMMGILSIGYRLGIQYNPVKPTSLPRGARGAATGTTLSPEQVTARDVAKKTALLDKASKVSGSTRKRILKQVATIERNLGGADKPSVATATADKAGQRKPLSVSKAFANDLKASKIAADAAKPGPASSFKTFLKKALDINFKSQGIANPTVPGITEDIARSNMFDDLAREFADEFEGKKPFSTIGREGPTAPRGNLIAPKLLKGIFGPEDLLNQKSLNLLKGLDFRFTLDDLARTFTFQNLKSTIKGGVAGFIIEFFARSIAKGVSDSLPFHEGDTIFGKLGLISRERMAKLRAQQILRMKPRERRSELKRLNVDAQSKPFFLDRVGNDNKKDAELVLREYLKLTLSEQPNILEPDTSTAPGSQTITPPLQTPSSEKIKPGVREYTSEELEQLREIQNRYKPQSSIPKPSMVASVNRSMSDGLDGETSYGSQGMIVIRQNHFVIQPVRVTA